MINKKELKLTISLMRNRRGTHVGMILSFVVFITFIVFLYSVVQPAIKTGEDKSTTLAYIASKISENVSSDLTTVSVRIDTNPGTNCVELQKFLAFFVLRPPYPVIVKNELGIVEEPYYGSTDNTNLVINRDNSGNVFFTVRFSAAFPNLVSNPVAPCTAVTGYNISLSRTDMYVFEKRIYELITYYNTSYEQLRTKFNIPPGNEFSFSFRQSNGTIVDAGGTGNVNVYAEETPIQYIDNNANILSGFINVKVW